MQKLLIYWVLGASVGLSGCSTVGKVGDSFTNALDRMPFVYRLDIQQGNMIDQEMVDKLQIGMTKTQVRYLLGTPLLVDTFHLERWDYIYRMKDGGEEAEQTRISLSFEDDRLSRIDGDLQPQPQDPNAEVDKETVASVPDYEPQKKGIVTRVMETVGLKSDEDSEQ